MAQQPGYGYPDYPPPQQQGYPPSYPPVQQPSQVQQQSTNVVLVQQPQVYNNNYYNIIRCIYIYRSIYYIYIYNIYIRYSTSLHNKTYVVPLYLINIVSLLSLSLSLSYSKQLFNMYVMTNQATFFTVLSHSSAGHGYLSGSYSVAFMDARRF